MNKSVSHTLCRFAAVALGSIAALQSSGLSADAPPATAPATQPLDYIPPQASQANLKFWFNNLDSDDPKIRSESFSNLMQLDGDALPKLKKIVADSRPLAPAQTLVLRQIVNQLYLTSQHYDGHPTRGFLGVHMEQSLSGFHDQSNNVYPSNGSGVVIVDRMPGFAGSRTLQDGDIILSIYDQTGSVPVASPEDFATIILAKGAGATLRFDVLRRGQVVSVTLTLDARPIEADQGIGGISDLMEIRRRMADDYWQHNFADLVKESIS